MHNYDIDINWLDISTTAAKISVILTKQENYRYIHAVLMEFLSCCHEVLYNGDKDMCKDVKQGLLNDVKKVLNNKIDRVNSQFIYKIAKCPNITMEERDNVLMTMARWPEFYLHSERDMMLIGENLTNHLDEINAISYIDKKTGKRLCPYSLKSYHNDMDIAGTLTAQESNVLEFLKSKGIFTKIRSSDLIRELDAFEERVIYDKADSQLEEKFIKSIRYIRARAKRCEDDIFRYISGHATYDQFGLSESRSPSSDNEVIMQTLHSMGWKKQSCPMVLDNLFHGQYPSLGIMPQKGQIPVPYDFEGFTTAVGLGPGKKIRFVFNCHADVQNSISPLADLIQESDRFVKDYMEAYNDQQIQINLDKSYITDAFCTDATGYSDYLTRTIYTYLLKLYGFSDNLINYILAVFRMPILIDGKRYEVKYGSMQGCKLLVFIMNHANRLIGILAQRLGGYRVDARSNAGDDVEVHRFEGYYTQDDINTEIALFAYFNCPCNETKTAWLKRDGYFDFCSKYYKLNDNKKGVHSITGIPPKIAGKQIVCIGQFAEIFKVLDVPGTLHRKCSESWNLLYPLLEPDLKQGCLLPNIYREYNQSLDIKIENARSIWYGVGGLADYDQMDVYKSWKLLKYKFSKMLEQYVFDPKGIFIIVNMMDQEFRKTELYKALGTVQRQSYGQIVGILDLIDSIETDYGLDTDDVKQLYTKIMRLERDIVHGTSISRNVSTYHRKTITKDIDTFIPIDKVPEDSGEKYSPYNLFTSSALLAALSKTERTSLNNIQMYVNMKRLYDKYKTNIITYYGYGGETFLAIDEGDGLRVRLESRHSDYKYRQAEGFKMPDEINNPEIAELYSLLTYYGVGKMYTLISDLLYNQAESTISMIARKQLNQLCRREVDRIVRKNIARIKSGFYNYVDI